MVFRASWQRRNEKTNKHRIMETSVNFDEFEYSESVDLGRGRHQQIIILGGKEIGFLVSKEKNWLAPITESYVIPDVEVGLSEPTSGMLDGKKGWIEFKVFVDNYESAFKYAKDNFEQVAYLFEVGDWD